MAVSFELARRVWDDPLVVVVPNRVIDGKQRWHAFGLVAEVPVLFGVRTYRDEDDVDVVRILGARKPTSHERRRYEHDGFDFR